MEQLLHDLEEIDKSDSDQQDEEVWLQSQGEKSSAKTHNKIPVTKPKSATRKPKVRNVHTCIVHIDFPIPGNKIGTPYKFSVARLSGLCTPMLEK